MEELVAELGAAFLSADLGLTPEPREDHAAYIGHWLNVLKNDKRAIFTAASHAQRAADFLAAFSGTRAAGGRMKAPVQTIRFDVVRLSRVGRLLPRLLCGLQGRTGTGALSYRDQGRPSAGPCQCLKPAIAPPSLPPPSLRHGAGWKPMCAAGSISTIAARASAKSPSNFRCFDTRLQKSRGRIGGRAGQDDFFLKSASNPASRNATGRTSNHAMQAAVPGQSISRRGTAREARSRS